MANTKRWTLDNALQKIFDEVTSRINVNASIVGSLAKVGNYQDLGSVIDAVNMAAGTTVVSAWFDGVEWVRNIQMMVLSDKISSVRITHRDSTQVADVGVTVFASIPASSPSYSPLSMVPQYSASGSTSVLGTSSRFELKNNDATPNTVAKLRVQLMGL